MKISIYGISNYDRASKARWLLEELGVDYENHWLNIEKGDLNEGPYLKVNPLGRIPAAQFDERPMIESGAICAYIADKYIDKGLAPALTAPERLDYQQWMYFAVSIDSFANRISIIEDIPEGKILNQKMSDLLSEIKDTIGFLNHTFSEKDYLTGQFSAADICVGYHLYFGSLWPEIQGIIEAHPHVASYLERLKQRDAAQKAKVFTYEA